MEELDLKIKKSLRLGVVGYCPPTKFDEVKALELIKHAYDRVEDDFPEYRIIVVSGLTNIGVLKIAYEEAKRRDWKTAGIACKKAYSYKDNWFPVDEEPIIIGENWGDESQAFINSIDALVRIGSGPQSLKEAEQVRRMGKPTYEYELAKIG